MTVYDWSKAKQCTNLNNCIQVLELRDKVVMRTTYKGYKTLEFTHKEWEAFKLGIIAGTFD